MHLPITGHPLHTRSLTMVAQLREDGRWAVRGDVMDLRKCGFVPLSADIQPAGIIHSMTIELVVEPALRRIEALETAQPFVAVEPSKETRGECCRDPAPRLQAVVGETLDAGFAKRLSAVFGGPRGCSHLLTLFQLMASALPAAIEEEEELVKRAGVARPAGDRLFRRSCFVDGYETADGAIELTVQLADFHSHPGPAATPLERLALEDAARVFARVEMPGLVMRDLCAAVRRRTGRTLAGAEWQDRTSEVAAIEGSPIIPGLARRVFGLMGPETPEMRLRDALLQLAPGHIQVLAAITDRWFADGSGAGRAATGSALPSGEASAGPAVGSLGGMPDSCYMWRTGGPMHAFRHGDGG